VGCVLSPRPFPADVGLAREAGNPIKPGGSSCQTASKVGGSVLPSPLRLRPGAFIHSGDPGRGGPDEPRSG
jgi:hypothetical protein